MPYSIRIIVVDSYMTAPTPGLDVMYSDFRGSAINQVPILRIFGSTETGKKICLHIHGVFPYLYIPYDGFEDVNSLMYQIANNLDKTINISLNQSSSTTQHVYKISLVSGIPMYGYHGKNHQFFKIYLYNPLLVRRVSNLLMNPTTLGKLYQPHETHVPFVLQFMIDYNLHGMSTVTLSEMKFRIDPNEADSNITPELILPTVKKLSVCEMEGDVFAEHILNRLEVASGNIGVNPGIATLWADEMQRRRNKGESSQIEHLLELKNTNVEPTKSHLIFKQALSDKLMVAATTKDMVNEKLSLSIYPAETPEDLDIENASMISSQSPSDLELSLNDTTLIGDVHDTSISEQLSETMDEETLNFLKILHSLEANAKEVVEEDSILSQVAKENEEEKDIDLSMPLDVIMTPKKIIANEEDADDDIDDLWNTTLIPQLDGECDDNEDNYDCLVINDVPSRRITRSYQKALNAVSKRNKEKIKENIMKKALYIKIIKREEVVKKGRHMPLLWDDTDLDDNTYFSFTSGSNLGVIEENKCDFKTDYNHNRVGRVNECKEEKSVVVHESESNVLKKMKAVKREKSRRDEFFYDGKVTKKTTTQIKSWEFQIKMCRKRIQLIKMMRKLHNKEHQICLLLSKNRRPIFKVIPADKNRQFRLQKEMKLRDQKKIDILSNIMLKTRNYIDPSLHITLQYPSKKIFLCIYNQKEYPEVTEIATITSGQDLKCLVIKQTRKPDNHKVVDCKNERTFVQVETSVNQKICSKNIEIKNTIKVFDTSSPLTSNETDITQLDNNDNVFKEYFSTKFIDSDNKKHIYIFSSKYLSSVRDNNLICNIKNQSIDQILQILHQIEKKLEVHIANLKNPVRDNAVGKDNNSLKMENLVLVQNSENLKCEDIRKKERRSKLNCSPKNYDSKKFLFLDGTVDSSSSDDESDTLKRKRTLRNKSAANFSRYSALPVTVCSSPTPSQGRSTDKHLVSQNILKKLGEEKKTSINKPSNQQAVCDIIKRRLNFGETCLQTTVIEEKLVCTYSPLKNEGKIFLSNDKKNLESTLDRTEKDTIVKTSNNQLNSEHSKTNKDKDSNRFSSSEDSNNSFQSASNHGEIYMECVSHSSQSDIFSDCDSAEDVDKSFFRSPEIANKIKLVTAAEKYDKDTNFKAKEGTSKVLTPQSCTSTQKSSEDSSFGLLTPSQHTPEQVPQLSTIYENENQNLQMESDKIFPFDIEDNEFLHTNSVVATNECDMFVTKVLIPVKKAPTREEVIKSLDSYKIPSVKAKEPFYGNVEDVTGSVEVGYNVLKITSNTSAHLSEFETQTDAINHYRKLKFTSMATNLEWKKANINNLALSFCKDKHCIITPIKKPPSIVQVKNWIKQKTKKVVSPAKKPERVKIFVPLSPGNNDNEDNDMSISLTLSPCTPVNSRDSASSVTSSQTPDSSRTTESSQESKKINKGETFSLSLRKSLLLSQDKSSLNNSCQITGVSPNNTYGFDRSMENLQAARAVIEHQHLTLLVMELHIRTRGDYKPNPYSDSIRAIFYSVLNDVPENSPKPQKCKGVVAINSLPLSPGVSKTPILDGAGVDCDIIYVDSEENLINEFLKILHYWDPDILAGYEIQMLSWGYLIDRASVLGINLKSLLNRIKEDKKYRNDGESELQVVGRIVLDVWRLMRHEIAIQSYTFESIVYHILQKRLPQYAFKDLSFWWDHRSTLYRFRTVHYYLLRVETILELFDKLDIVGRTSELARLFGIQFYEVLSRGSQFRVESMMLRLAKPLNFIPVSPSVQQRATMNAPEYIPLVLEPESKLYNDPVIVLDFQSLYPSIIIAYNYCFTTCVGNVESLGKNTPFEFGASQLKMSKRFLGKLLKKNLINFSPCGVGFVKKKIRDGILPRMLREILDTRLMVKNSMKENKEDLVLQKVLHNRQLGLKLIANVTYGYTAANFSGRMPLVELGDSVVSKGRETLQRAIEMVDSTSEWGARVVYGDTDSLFVLVPGKSRQHAFEIGKKIADAVTKANPDPVKLKLEKVYQPCILQTKKRYVGYMYESPDQKEPVYDAKGIETVRRDGCPAVSKMLEKCLRLLFETKDISLVKKYVLRQFNKIIAGKASIQDLTFAKEYRGMSGYRPGACVPSLELARKWMAVDKRNEPRSGERVPYIVVNGPPGLPLIRLVRSPRDLLNDPSLRPNALYYITKVIIPPINRCFNLIGADVNIWYNQMPRKQMQILPSSVSPGKKSTISQYFSTSSCVACGEQTQTGICGACVSKPQITCITLMEKLRVLERSNYECNLICQSCTRTQTEIKCVSLDCPVLYRRVQAHRHVQQTSYIRDMIASSDFLF